MCLQSPALPAAQPRGHLRPVHLRWERPFYKGKKTLSAFYTVEPTMLNKQQTFGKGDKWLDINSERFKEFKVY